VWTADPAVCSAQFAVRNFGFRTVAGLIPVTMAELTVGDNGHPGRIRAELDAGGLDTGNRQRDRDLRKPRFLDTARWPVMTFTSDDIRARGDGWAVHGTLTVKGTACLVQLDVAAPHPARPVPGGPVELRGVTQFDRRTAGVTAGPGFLIGHLVSVSLSVRLRPPA
jgi:polyisoprenoid-binding protein YceI